MISLAGAVSANDGWISAHDSRIQYQGRVDRSLSEAVRFDWPGTRIVFRVEAREVWVRLKGENMFEATIDGALKPAFAVSDSVGEFQLAKDLEPGAHTIVLSKRTESLGKMAFFEGLRLVGDSAQLLEAPAPKKRRIEFIGDSYTVGYGNESTIQTPLDSQTDSLIFFTTNTQKSFAHGVGNRLGAEVHVSAISGRGLLRNYNGFDPGKELPYYLDRALITPRQERGEAPLWDANAWHPHVVVITLGINDWQGEPPYPDSVAWDKAYGELLDRYRTLHPGVQFVLCATPVWPTEAMIPRVRAVVEQQKKAGHQDVVYFEFRADKTGLWFHPSVYDHEAIAQALIPVVVRAGRWLSR